MKLRLRSLESKETQRIEVPNTCNLQQLKQIIISSSSSSSTVVLSLNRKDELSGVSSQDSLQSLGVTSGDLIYYSHNLYAFLSPNPNLLHIPKDETVNLRSAQVLDCGKVCNFDVSSDEPREFRDAHVNEVEKLSDFNDSNCNFENTQMVKSGGLDEIVSSSGEDRVLDDTQMHEMSKLSNFNDSNGHLENTQIVKSGGLDEIVGSSVEDRVLGDTQMDETSKLSNPGNSNAQMMESERWDERDASTAQIEESVDDEKAMEVIEGSDEMEVDDESVINVNTRLSVPGFLKKVLVKEVGDDAANGGNHKLLVIAVHAVLLESGFVCYDPISGMKVDGFHLPDIWPSSGFSILLHYTLPVISSYEVVETVVLKFQTTGKFVNVYGALSRKQGEFHRVCLDEHKLTPALNYIWKKSYCTEFEKEGDASVKLYPNQEIFEFWKNVKDGLSYPLLIELCEQVGLVPPPCLMLLPTELKLKILEALPAIDVAKMACVSSELQFVASSNDLWKMKYEEVFGTAASSQRERQWKADFSAAWEIRKKKKRLYVPLQWREPPHLRPFFPGRRAPNPLPFVIGGDYDRMPAFGIPQPPGRRIFRRNCDLGGFGV